jgi:hypothetical protein
MEIKQAHNEIAVYFSNNLQQWIIETNNFLKSVGTYKQAQKEARSALWAMNKYCELKNCKGQIFYARKSDGLVTLNEYIGFDRKFGWIIKSERMNIRRAA